MAIRGADHLPFKGMTPDQHRSLKDAKGPMIQVTTTNAETNNTVFLEARFLRGFLNAAFASARYQVDKPHNVWALQDLHRDSIGAPLKWAV